MRTHVRVVGTMLLLLALSLLALGAGADEANLVDRPIDALLAGKGIAPSCSDAEFLRRLSLDLTGSVPRVEDARAFLAHPDRASTIETLLASEEFNAWWGRFLLETLTERRAVLDDLHNGRALHEWLTEQLRKRRPYDEVVRDLIVAKGNNQEAPEVNFLLRYNVRPSDITGTLGRAFLGNSMRCAQCHTHPFDPKITQQDFWGVASYFARTKRYYVEDDQGNVAGVTEVRRGAVKMPSDVDEDGDEKEQGNPEKPAIVVKPHWPGLADEEGAGRAELARHVTSDPRFAKNIVNRIWARLMGRGLVEPLDGFDSDVQPSHPDLLDALAGKLVTSGHDLRAVIRVIVSSRAYQRSCRAEGSDAAPYARAAIRPLSTDQLFLSVVRATRFGLDEDGSESDPPDASPMDMEAAREDEKDYADSYPPSLFGGSPRSLRRALALLNHGDVHYAVDSAARFTMKLFGKPVTPQHFEYITYAFLSRPPSESERARYAGKTRRSDLEDAVWAIMNSLEFRSNH